MSEVVEWRFRTRKTSERALRFATRWTWVEVGIALAVVAALRSREALVVVSISAIVSALLTQFQAQGEARGIRAGHRDLVLGPKRLQVDAETSIDRANILGSTVSVDVFGVPVQVDLRLRERRLSWPLKTLPIFCSCYENGDQIPEALDRWIRESDHRLGP